VHSFMSKGAPAFVSTPRSYVSASMILVCVLSILASAPQILSEQRLMGYTTTYTTTMEVTYNYLTVINGTTVMGGYLTSTIATVVTTVTGANLTSGSGASTTAASTPPQIDGFSIESVLSGLLLGVLLLTLLRRRRQRIT